MKIFFKLALFSFFLILLVAIFEQKSNKALNKVKNNNNPTPTLTIPPNHHFYLKPADGPTIQQVIDIAGPGDTIELSPGVYFQDIITKRDGQPSAPLTIRGPKSAIIKGSGSARIIEINHSYIILDGFTIDGLAGFPFSKSAYRDKLIYIHGKKPGQGPSFLKLINLEVKNGGGECIRLRYFSQNNEIASNNIGPCGIHDFVFKAGGKNGEAIYIGTAPEQINDKKNPDTQVDQSNRNYIHNNIINTQGNECVDIKEGSSKNIVEYNKCTGQKDVESGGFDSRGNDNVFRNNEIFDNLGAGIRLGGDQKTDGVNNDVYQNLMKNNQSGGIKFQRKPQGKVCGNEFLDNKKGDSVGSEGKDFSPEAPC